MSSLLWPRRRLETNSVQKSCVVNVMLIQVRMCSSYPLRTTAFPQHYSITILNDSFFSAKPWENRFPEEKNSTEESFYLYDPITLKTEIDSSSQQLTVSPCVTKKEDKLVHTSMTCSIISDIIITAIQYTICILPPYSINAFPKLELLHGPGKKFTLTTR